MPGRHINDQQVRLYMRQRADHTQITSAAKAGLSVSTARRTSRKGRAQLVSGVRRELALRGEALLQPVQ